LIQVKIRQHLLNQAELASLVGDRIYPNYISETATHPAISYFRVSNVRPRIKDGHMGEARPRFQFDIWAKTYKQAVEVEMALLRALDGLESVDDVLRSEYAGGHESYEQDVKVHHFVVDYFIFYKE
jgi:hypothetical protein